MNLNATMKKLQRAILSTGLVIKIGSFIIARSVAGMCWKLCKMWGEVTHAPYGKIIIGTVRGGKGRICANTAK